MKVKDFFENFEDEGNSIVRAIVDNENLEIRIGYKYIDKESSAWLSFIATYGNYFINKWCLEKSKKYKIITVYIEKILFM